MALVRGLARHPVRGSKAAPPPLEPVHSSTSRPLLPYGLSVLRSDGVGLGGATGGRPVVPGRPPPVKRIRYGRSGRRFAHSVIGLEGKVVDDAGDAGNASANAAAASAVVLRAVRPDIVTTPS